MGDLWQRDGCASALPCISLDLAIPLSSLNEAAPVMLLPFALPRPVFALSLSHSLTAAAATWTCKTTSCQEESFYCV